MYVTQKNNLSPDPSTTLLEDCLSAGGFVDMDGDFNLVTDEGAVLCFAHGVLLDMEIMVSEAIEAGDVSRALRRGETLTITF